MGVYHAPSSACVMLNPDKVMWDKMHPQWFPGADTSGPTQGFVQDSHAQLQPVYVEL